MKDIYLYLNSSKDDIYNNKFFDFTCTLPRVLDLSTDEWEIGLAESHFFTNKKYTKLFIYCDIISSSFTPSKSEQILRFIPTVNETSSFVFNKIFYLDIRCNFIHKIRLYIKSETDNSVSLSDETLYCTLHIRKKKSQ